MESIINKDLQIMKILLHNGADPDFTPFGFNPLFWACVEKNVDAFMILLDYCANIHASQYSILGQALFNECIEIINILLLKDETCINFIDEEENNYRIHALYYPIKYDNITIVKILITNGVNINLKYENENNAIMLALLNERQEIAEYLVQQPDINLGHFNDEGKTAYDIAVDMENTKMVELLTRKCICNENALFQCIECKQSYYCSKECQVAHWKEHRKICCCVN
jgi:ankyrin repeat protein